MPTAPTGVTVDGSAHTSLDVSWTDASSDEDAFRVEASDDAGSTWPHTKTVAKNSESATLSGLDTGTEYTVRVIARSPSTEAASATTTGTTTLPDPVVAHATSESDGGILTIEDVVSGEAGTRVEARTQTGGGGTTLLQGWDSLNRTNWSGAGLSNNSWVWNTATPISGIASLTATRAASTEAVYNSFITGPARPDDWQTYVRADWDAGNDCTGWVNFCFQNTTNYYALVIDFEDEEVQFYSRVSGTFTLLDEDLAASFESGETYRIEVSWDANDIDISVVNDDTEATAAVVPTVTDTAFTDGGLGYDVSKTADEDAQVTFGNVERLEAAASSPGDWRRVVCESDTISAADTLGGWYDDPNVTLSLESGALTEDGTAIRSTIDDGAGAANTKDAQYNPSGTVMLGDCLQFWHYAEYTGSPAFELHIYDNSANWDWVSFADQVTDSTPGLIDIDLAEFSGVDMQDVDRFIFRMDGATNEFQILDGVITGMQVCPAGTTDIPFGRFDTDEDIELRVRSESSAVTGSWQMYEGRTNLSAPTGMGASPNTEFGVLIVSYTDTEAAERRYRFRVERLVDGSYETIALGRDRSGLPSMWWPALDGETYRYSIGPEVGITAAETTTTYSTPTRNTPTTAQGGWQVEVEHPDGATLTPTPLDDPQFTPSLKSLPVVRIPVARDDMWLNDSFEDAPMSVWRNGVKLPIEQLIDVEVTPGRCVLVAEGGVELKARHQVEYDLDETWSVAADFVAETSYTDHVDEDEGTVIEDQTFQEVYGLTSWTPVASIADDVPLEVDTEAVTLNVQQTAWWFEAEDTGTQGPAGFGDLGDYSGGDACGFFGNVDDINESFVPDHDIAEGDLSIAIRRDVNSAADNHVAFDVFVEGVPVESIPQGALSPGLQWYSFAATPDNEASLNISAGQTVDVDIEATGSGDAFNIDCVVAYDNRYPVTLDNTVDASGHLATPKLYRPVEFVGEWADTGYAIEAANLFVVMNNTSGGQAIELEVENETPVSASNATSVEGTFDTTETRVRGKVTLDGYGSRSSASPTTGYLGQQVGYWGLYGDVRDTPLVINRTFDGGIRDSLTELAVDGNYVWEVTWDTATQSIAVEWTRPGERETDVDLSMVDYTVKKSTGEQYDKAVIYGGSRQVVDERQNAAINAAVGFDNSPVVESSESLSDPSDGSQYERGPDYEIDNLAGTFTAQSGGAIGGGTEVACSYSYRHKGSYSTGVPDAMTTVQSVPGATTDRACQNAAFNLISELSSPLYVASVVVPAAALPPDVPLVDALSVVELPGDTRMTVQSIEHMPDRIELQMGSRRGLSEVLNQIRERLSSTMRRV